MFSTSVLIRQMWQHKTVVFLHRCLINPLPAQLIKWLKDINFTSMTSNEVVIEGFLVILREEDCSSSIHLISQTAHLKKHF